MSFDAYDTNTSTGDKHSAFALITKDRTDALRNHHLGSAAPSSPVEGDVWFDNTSATRFLVKLYQNGGWIILTDKIAEGDRDFDANEAQNVHLEELVTGSLPTAAAGTESRIWWDSTLEKPGTCSSAVNSYFAVCNADATTDIRVPMRMHVASLATPATANTATELGGWTLDAAADELCGVARVPAGWTAANDLTVEVQCLLLVAETAADDIDMDGNWISITPGSGDGASKTETGFAAVTQDIGAGNAQYDIHTVTLVVDHDDATNPVAAGDTFRCTINHNAAGQVAGIIVIGMDLVAPCFNFSG